jgi:hypothetical protein
VQRVLLCSDCRDLRVQLQRKGTRADGLEGNYGGTLSFPGRSGRADPLLLARKDLAGTRFLAVGTRRVQLVRRDGRDVSTLYGRVWGGGGARVIRLRPEVQRNGSREKQNAKHQGARANGRS